MGCMPENQCTCDSRLHRRFSPIVRVLVCRSGFADLPIRGISEPVRALLNSQVAVVYV